MSARRLWGGAAAPPPPPLLKLGLYGWQGSGKSFTSALVAGVLLKRGLLANNRVALIDSENGSRWVIPVYEALGLKVEVLAAHEFALMLEACRQAEQDGFSVVTIDSVTNFWDEAKASFLEEVNKVRASRGLKRKWALDVSDWSPIKDRWRKFATWLVGASCHVIACGRAGTDFVTEEKDDGAGRDLRKVGSKMRAEGEFGHEPDILWEMQLQGGTERKKGSKLDRPVTARFLTVLKDRSNTIMGRTFELESSKDVLRLRDQIEEVFGDFLDHVALSGTKQPPKAEGQGTFSGMAEEAEAFEVAQTIVEEVRALLFERWPGQTREARTQRADVVFDCAGVRSWTAVEKMTLAQVAVVARRIAASAGLAVPSVVLDAESRFPEIKEGAEGEAKDQS